VEQEATPPYAFMACTETAFLLCLMSAFLGSRLEDKRWFKILVSNLENYLKCNFSNILRRDSNV
jgi:hypothetical protein